MTNLYENLGAASAIWPDRFALRCDDLAFSFAEFDDAAAKVATLLERADVRPGDRVGVMLGNTPAFAIVFYGIMRCGAVAVPINPLLKAGEIEFYLVNTGAVALVATPLVVGEARAGAARAGVQRCWIVDDAALGELIRELPRQAALVRRSETDTAVILHTSGTTGGPKGAQLTHGGLHRNAEVSARALLEIGPGDVVIGCLPLFHSFGLTCGLNASVLSGATLTLIERFDPHKALEVIERDGVTVFEGVPAMYSALLQSARSVSPTATRTLRTCISGGAALPVQVITEFEQTFACAILEGYGLSETSPVASFNHPRLLRKPGSIGTPIDGVAMRVVGSNGEPVGEGEAGEIQIRGHNVMTGYWNQPDATSAAIDSDGWFSTGDIGCVDSDGYYYIVDRVKDLIIRGGYNVYPREVEEVLYQHPAVAEAAVLGIPHASLGEEIGAAVTLKKPRSVDEDELRDFVKNRLAAYKYPRRIWFVESLPKGPTGKTLRREIRLPATEPAYGHD